MKSIIFYIYVYTHVHTLVCACIHTQSRSGVHSHAWVGEWCVSFWPHLLRRSSFPVKLTKHLFTYLLEINWSEYVDLLLDIFTRFYWLICSRQAHTVFMVEIYSKFRNQTAQTFHTINILVFSVYFVFPYKFEK